MSKSKENAREKYEDANKLYNAQIYDEALTCYQKATKLDLTFTDAHFCVAKTHIRLQSFEKAIKYFQKHRNLIPEKALPMYVTGLAGILQEEGQHEKAFELLKERGDAISGEQLPTYLKILLANGKFNQVLLHLLNLPRERAPELYQQVVNDQSINETHRKEFQQEYAIPEYHRAADKAALLSNAPAENTTFSEKAAGLLTYVQQGKKDFGENFQRYLDTLNDKITEVQHLLADRVQHNINHQNASRAQTQLNVLAKTDYDPVKVQNLRNSLAAVKKQTRDTYLKYAGVVVLALLVLFGAVELFGYINDRSSWKEAQAADNYESYQKYLNKYPDGSYTANAYALAEERYWNQIKDTSDPDAFDNYLEKFPGAKHELKALNKFNDLTPRERSVPSRKVTLQKSPQNSISKRARVTGSDVIIRSDHTTESKVAGVVKREGTEVRILDEYYASNSNEAILKRTISVYEHNHSIELHKGKAVTIVSRRGNQVRVSFVGEKDGKVTTTINKNNLESISSKKWYKVRTSDNTTGWIYGKFIDAL